jgi:hypothetical protein
VRTAIQVTDDFRDSGHHNTPTRAGHRVDLVGLKSEDSPVCGRGQAGAFRRSQYDGVMENRERDRNHGRQGRLREDDAPDKLARQQLDRLPA